MAAQTEPATVDDPARVEFVDHRGEVVAQVVLVVVVDPPRFAHDRGVGLDHHVAQADQVLDRPGSEVGERVLVEGARALVVRLLVLILPRVEPEHGRALLALLEVRRHRHVHQEPESVGAFHGEALPRRIGQVGRVVDVVRQLRARVAVRQIGLADLGRRLPVHDEAARVGVQHRRNPFRFAVVGALVDPLLVARADVDPVHEAPGRLRQRILEVLRAGQEDGFRTVFARDLHEVACSTTATTAPEAEDGASTRAPVVHQQRSRVGVEVVGIPLADRVARLGIVQPDRVLGHRAAGATSAEGRRASAAARPLRHEQPTVIG